MLMFAQLWLRLSSQGDLLPDSNAPIWLVRRGWKILSYDDEAQGKVSVGDGHRSRIDVRVGGAITYSGCVGGCNCTRPENRTLAVRILAQPL